MAEDSYIISRLYVPIVMIILLTMMIYFHKHHKLRYLYIVNIFCYFAAIFSYFVLHRYIVGEKASSQWMIVISFIWLIGIFGGYFLSIASIGAFVIENAQRHIWAKVTMGIAAVVFIVSSITGIYFFIQGILSLKSG